MKYCQSLHLVWKIPGSKILVIALFYNLSYFEHFIKNWLVFIGVWFFRQFWRCHTYLIIVFQHLFLYSNIIIIIRRPFAGDGDAIIFSMSFCFWFCSAFCIKTLKSSSPCGALLFKTIFFSFELEPGEFETELLKNFIF